MSTLDNAMRLLGWAMAIVAIGALIWLRPASFQQRFRPAIDKPLSAHSNARPSYCYPRRCLTA